MLDFFDSCDSNTSPPLPLHLLPTHLNPMPTPPNPSLRTNQSYLLCPKCLLSHNTHAFIKYREDDNGWIIGEETYSYEDNWTEEERMQRERLREQQANGSAGTPITKCTHYTNKKIVKTLEKDSFQYREIERTILGVERVKDEESSLLSPGKSPKSTKSPAKSPQSPPTSPSHGAAPIRHDIEDLIGKFESKHFAVPLVVDLPLVDSEGEVRSVQDIARDFKTIQTKCRGRDFILRLHGKLATNIVQLNERVHHVLQMERRVKQEGLINVLDLSAERLCLLIDLENSVLLDPRVHPSVHVYADLGEEQEACKELLTILDKMQHVENIQLIVNIIVSRPFPDLVSLLALVRSHKRLCKFILIEMERAPSQIMKQVQSEPPTADNTDPAPENLDMNPQDLLEHIERCSAGSIRARDFFPASYGIMLEPFLRWLKIGNFRIRPAPMCGFCTVLINSEEYNSTPVSQLLDMPFMYTELLKVFPRLQKTKSFPGFLLTRKLKKIFKTAGERRGVKVPNIFSYMLTLDTKKKAQMERVMNEMQFMVVHNKMDIGCIDAKRRTLCSMCELDSNGTDFIAQCTQII